MNSQMASIRLALLSWILVVCYVKSCFGVWYIGCYTEHDSSNFTLYGNSSVISSGVACSSLCYNQGFSYAALSNGAECKCSNSFDGISETNSASCSIRCLIDSRQLCGSNSSLSVYSVDGPYVRGIEVTSVKTLIQESTEIYIEAEVWFADVLDSFTGLLELNSSLHIVEVTWRINGSIVKQESESSVNSTSLVAALTYKFHQQGIWIIDVEVENPISNMTGSISITVVLPAPRNLQVLLKGNPESIPSCIPVKDSVPVHLPSVVVFKNEEVMFQASVDMGSNLTFVWEFENGSSYIAAPYLESVCTRITCMQQHVKNHTFISEGVEKVSVNVSNSLGSLYKELYVVVVEKRIANLSLMIDNEFASYHNKPNTAVIFSLTLLTTARQDTSLEVEFGDGRRFNLSLQDENDMFIRGGFSDSNPNPHLIADYGESCTLSISFQHKYQNSGVYYVKAKVFSDNITLQENLEKPIIIQNVISYSRLLINSPYALGSVTNFTVRLSPSFNNRSSDLANTTFNWELFLHNSSILTEYTRDAVFSHVFTEAGRYILAVNVSNLVSYDYIEKYLIVQEPIHGLLINSTSSSFISLGSIVHVVASVSKGTNVTFKWNFGESDTYVTPSPVALANRYQKNSAANYTYWEVGSYSIRVIATNLVSQQQALLAKVITVEEKVSGFSLVNVSATVLGDPTEIFCTIREGSHVRFAIDIGTGPESVTVTEEGDALFKIEYNFHQPGVYNVIVTAFNDVSSVEDVGCVIVQANLDDIQVVPVSDVFIQQVSKITLKNNGKILDRSDLLFQWSVEGKNFSTVVPFLSYTFQTIGLVKVEVLVSNLVTEKTLSVEFEVSGGVPPMSLSHLPFNKVSIPVMFILIDMQHHDGDAMVEMDFGDNNSVIMYWNNSEALHLSHTFFVPGVYEITANVTFDRLSIEVISILSIQEQILNISLQGPNISRFQRPESSQIWNVAKSSGSAILYTWTTYHLAASPGFELQPMKTFATVLQKGSVQFTAAGWYNISVNASNHLSWQVAHIQTQLQQPIINASVSMATVLHGQNSTIEVAVQGESPFILELDYGDGQTAVYSSQDLTETVFGNPNTYVYRYAFTKLYSLDGEYTCSVVITNSVSSRSVTVRGVVEATISGVKLVSDSPSVVRSGEEVTMIATVEKGSNIFYEWDLGDQQHISLVVDNFGNTSMATYTFSIPGVYRPGVRISNALQSEPMTITYAGTFRVLDVIDNFVVIPLNGKYSTPLHVIDNETMATDRVYFRAECSGTGVSFIFNFGDGSPLVTKHVADDGTNSPYTNAGHKYYTEGSYMVTVTAINDVSNATAMLSQRFIVQIPPFGLEFEQSHYVTKFGDYTNLTVSVDGGSDLEFSWSMGDQTNYMNRTSVSHKYQSVNQFVVTVTASNRAQSVSEQCNVSVEAYVQGVSLSILSSSCQDYEDGVKLCETDSIIEFRAETIVDIVDIWFYWNMGEGRNPASTSSNATAYYTRSGRYNVTVEASNDNSNAVSEPISLLVQTPVKDLSITSRGTSIIGFPSLFYARVSGSDLTYIWNFGDGTIENSTSNSIYHIYNRTGEYVVAVEVKNLLSQANTSVHNFVLKQSCMPPDIKFVGNNTRMVNKSDNIEIETDIKLNCSITMLAKYNWSIRYSNNTEITQYCGQLNQRNLYLMKRCLTTGTYIIMLEVRMNGTIVYTRESMELTVLRTPLVALIEGGTHRSVGRYAQIVLMGNYSYSPDEPVGTNKDGLRYNWTCHLLTKPSVGCFDLNKPSPLAAATSSVVTVHTTSLSPNFGHFVFVLYLSKDEYPTSRTSQVITVEEVDHLDVMMKCPQCVNGVLNVNDVAKFQALCPTCVGKLEYEWSVYVVIGASPPPYSVLRCIPPEGVPDYLLASNQTKNESNNVDVYSYSSPSAPLMSSEMSNVIGDLNTDTPVIGIDGVVTHTRVTQQPTPMPADSLPKTTELSVDPDEVSSNEEIFEDSYIINENSDYNDNFPDTDTNDQGTPTEGAPADSDTVKDFADDDDPPLSLILTNQRWLLVHQANLSSTMKDRAFVINSDYFKEGQTYSVRVKVTETGGYGYNGLASYYFRVNQNPSLGRCIVSPLEGIELSTIFSVSCVGWKDMNLPLRYEISYGQNESSNTTLIYDGMNSKIMFTLPSGPPDMDYKVYVKIAIVDSIGGRTDVCSIPTVVSPKEVANISTENYLYSKTVGLGNELQEKVDVGLPQEIYHFTNTIVQILNQLTILEDGDPTMEMALSQRRDIRQSLLKAIGYIPNRNPFELQMRASFVDAVCQRPSELTLDSVEVAAHIISQVATQASSREEEYQHLLQHSISATSGLLLAISMSHINAMYSTKMNIAQSIVDAMALLLKVDLEQLAINQFPIEFGNEIIKAIGSRRDVLSSLTVNDGNIQFSLPDNMDAILKNQTNFMTPDDHCHDVALTTYKVNPYYWNPTGPKVTTGVASLELYKCDGVDLLVKDLQQGDEIDINVPHNLPVQNSEPGNFTYDKANMNIHEFNVTEMNMQQTLHYTLEFSSIAKRESFPLRVLLRLGKQPTPYQYDLKWDYVDYENDIEEVFPPGFFNETGTYYLALLDPAFDQTMYQFDHPSGHYLLRIWWAECLYWNNNKGAWVPDGCELLPTSDYEVTNCRCNHLTVFGASFIPIVKLIERISMSDFQIPNENPITFVFVLVTFGIYLMLFFYCRYADLHDEKKQGTIFLKDNQPTDQQYYEITIETGFRSGATTTAAISIVLHGEDGYSETKELKAHDKALFERNSRDRFIASVPESLGNLTKIHIWHNNAGRSPSWFLSRVAVRDLLSGQKWYFICERWFAVEEDDGKIEREIPVQTTGIGFQKAFFAKGAQYFSDYYLWSSVFTRPPYSCFTRVQRLTVCLSILMDFFCINTIWYQLLDKEEVDLGLIDVSGESVLVGIVTALLAIPINFPIIMFFRRIRPKTERDPKETYNNIKCSFEPSPDAEIQPILNEKSFEMGLIEQTALNLQNLQQWTTENWIKKQKGSMGAFDSDSGRSSQEMIFRDNGSISSGFDEYAGGLARRSSVDTKNSGRNRNSDSGMSSPECQSLDSFTTFSSQYETNHKKLTSPKYMFPHWCLYIAYTLCFTIIGISTIVAVYLGYRFNHTKAIYWIQSVYFSFLQCVFITQPAVMAMFTIAKSIRHRNNVSIFDHYDDNLDLLSKREMKQIRTNVFIYGNDISKGIEARQRSRYLRYARPPQPKQIQKAKEKTIKEKNMYAILKDTVIYSLILMCLLWMAYGRDTSNNHLLNKSVFNTYVQTPQPFTEISSVQEFWTWSQTDLLDGLFNEKWYNGDNQTDDQAYVMDGDTVLLGKASIRQLRVHQNSCRVANVMEKHFNSCQDSYATSREETGTYGTRGVGWFYSSKSLLKRYTQWGQMDRYNGGGYVVDLNSTRSSATAQLKDLQKNGWIDDQTRMVIVEFTLFNAPYRLFSSVALLAEMPGTGAIYPLPKIESVLLYRYESKYDYFIFVLELLFLLLVAVSGKREVHKAIKLKIKYFSSIWSWVELSMILLSLVYFVMYVYRFAYVTEVIERMKRTFNEEFVDMSFLAFWDQCLRSIIGAILFVVTIKFLHLLRFNRKVAMFGAVIQQAFKPLVILLVSLFVIQIAFSSLGVLLFGAFYKPFNELFSTTASIITLLVGKPGEHDEVHDANPALWTVFYISYIATVFIAFYGLAKAILCCSYTKVKNQKCDTVSGREVLKFFCNELLLVLGIRMLPYDDSNQNDELSLEFTIAEIEYQVDELLFRMSALTHQHGLPEKNFGYYGDSDNGMDDNMSFFSSEPPSSVDEFLEERLERIQHDMYSKNPELRHLIEGTIDAEDMQKQLRSQLELEIFRQLQLVRQEEDRQRLEQLDSGRDTQSEQTDMPFDDPTLHPLVRQAFLWGGNGASIAGADFNTNYQDIGQFGNWMRPDMPQEGTPNKGHSREDIQLEEFSDCSSRMDEWTNRSSSYSEIKDDSSDLRKSPKLHELTAETSFSYPRSDSTRSGSAKSANTYEKKRNAPRDIVRDLPEVECTDKTITVDDFQIPNALFSSNEDLTENLPETKCSRTKHKGSDLRNRLRKTKSRGKGKGRNRIDLGSGFLNDAFSSDEDIPVVHMGI